MFICVLYWSADKDKERFAGNIGTCSNCKGIRQSAGRNLRLSLRSAKKGSELCAGMLICWYLLRTICLWAVGSVCKTHTQNTSRTNEKKTFVHNVHSLCHIYWFEGEGIQKRILMQLAEF